MTSNAESWAIALRLVRRARDEGTAAGALVPEDALSAVTTTLANMAAGLLNDYGRAVGIDAGVLLDRLACAAMERSEA